jgi:D-alanyl-D-alanine carboxypeptidase/D-alanyl-D-alanine-endopeptidase (penicillin-binding protein 4)
MTKKFLFIYIIFSSLLFATSKEEIANKIREILSSLPPNTISGILIYDPLTQDTIFALNEYRPMTPASLTKLFTTSTSLVVMDGDHKLAIKH